MSSTGGRTKVRNFLHNFRAVQGRKILLKFLAVRTWMLGLARCVHEWRMNCNHSKVNRALTLLLTYVTVCVQDEQPCTFLPQYGRWQLSHYNRCIECYYTFYSTDHLLFTPRKARSSLRINGEQRLLDSTNRSFDGNVHRCTQKYFMLLAPLCQTLAYISTNTTATAAAAAVHVAKTTTFWYSS